MDTRAYFIRWQKRKSKKFRAAVERAAEKRAYEMFVELVSELSSSYDRLGIKP